MDSLSKHLSPFAIALREARLSRQLSISEVAKATLLSDKQIIGLENDDLSYFYTSSYAANSAKKYAEFIGVSIALSGAPSYGEVSATQLSPNAIGLNKAISNNSFSSGFRIGIWSLIPVCLGVLFVIGVINANIETPTARDQNRKNSKVTEVSSSSDEKIVGGVDATPFTSVRKASNNSMATADRNFLEKTASVPSSGPVPSRPPNLIKHSFAENDEKSRRFFLVMKRASRVHIVDGNGKSISEGVRSVDDGRRISGVPPFQVTLESDESAEVYYLGNRIRSNGPPSAGIKVSLYQ